MAEYDWLINLQAPYETIIQFDILQACVGKSLHIIVTDKFNLPLSS